MKDRELLALMAAIIAAPHGECTLNEAVNDAEIILAEVSRRQDLLTIARAKDASDVEAALYRSGNA